MTESTNIQVTPNLLHIFNTPEIFELILSCLPVRDLLLVQRVCKTWKTTITSSPTLQEALFFKPSSVPDKSDASTSLSADNFVRNPLIESQFPPFVAKPENQHRMFGSKDLLSMPWNRDEQSRAAYARKEASWRKMLLVQPATAVQEIELLHMSHGMGGDTLSIAGARLDPITCLRMGWIYDRCSEAALSPVGNFGVRWHMLKTKKLWAPKLTIFLHHTVQCTGGRFSENWKLMWSQAHAYVDLEFKDHEWTTRSMSEGFSRHRVPRRLIYDKEDVITLELDSEDSDDDNF